MVGIDNNLVYYKATSTSLHFLTVGHDKAQAKTIHKTEFIASETIKAGARPLFLVMPDGTLLTYHYHAPKLEVGKKIDSKSYGLGIVQTYDLRSRRRQIFDEGIFSSLSEHIFIHNSVFFAPKVNLNKNAFQ